MSIPISADDGQTPGDPVRSDAGQGGEVVAEPGAASGAVDERGTQDVPSMDTHDTTVQAKIDGIVAQTRGDFPDGADPERLAHALRQRFRDTGIEVDEEQVRSLAAG